VPFFLILILFFFLFLFGFRCFTRAASPLRTKLKLGGSQASMKASQA